MDFVEEHGIGGPERPEQCRRLDGELDRTEVDTVRLVWPDQHGVLRAKTTSVAEFRRCLTAGKPFQLAPMLMDTANHPAASPFTSASSFGIAELRGLPDGVVVPDPTSFRVLPWAAGSAWVLGDLYLRQGVALPLCSRSLLRRLLAALAASGLTYRTGLEIEFVITRIENARLSPEECGHPPEAMTVSAMAHGYQYLSDDRQDALDDIVRLLARTAEALNLPLATTEIEWGPGQLEFTFAPQDALATADTCILFRSMVKQVCRRRGLHASFMALPGLANANPNGMHHHQSLWRDDVNVFADPADPQGLSTTARHFLGGLLAFARETCLLMAPSINSYKRYQPNSFAPYRVCWTKQTRGSLVRAIGDGGSDTRLENRGGDAMANPYLLAAGQLAAGLEGIDKGLDPGPSDDEPGSSERERLPDSLMVAIEAFAGSALYRRRFGDHFVDYLATLKRHEAARFLAHVTDWEQREYFENF